jgi:hypothetical protein
LRFSKFSKLITVVLVFKEKAEAPEEGKGERGDLGLLSPDQHLAKGIDRIE